MAPNQAIVKKEIELSTLPVVSLKRRGADLSDPRKQLEILNQPNGLPRFEASLAAIGIDGLTADGIEILQVNVGKLCNMTCRHCHVDAGPDRKEENMDRETIDACLAAIRDSGIKTVDLTGGAPEMNADFKYFVTAARELGCHVIDRCNLTILLANGFTELPEFLAENQVEIVASLPCYLEENADSQRGDGSFQKSITALKRLNEVGYGREGSGLTLTLVYNPIGPALPPDQGELEQAYREQLESRFGIQFNRLFTITNMPISRFLDDLLESGQFENYMNELVNAFNPAAARGVMCRKMLSVGWDGRLFDCDFNQMLELPTTAGQPRHIRDFSRSLLDRRSIVTARHCFGCTAAAGSGCLGAIEG